MKRRVTKPCRSALFVPGNKPSWVAKAVASGVDSLILDLEDSVAVAEKSSARLLVKEAIKALDERGKDCAVRINGFATGMTLDDLESILCGPGIDHGADIDIRVPGIAQLEGSHLFQQQLQGLVPDRTMDQNPLDRDAVLAGIGESTDRDAAGLARSGVRGDDQTS